MNRQIIPGTFWSMVVLCLVLAVGGQWRAFAESNSTKVRAIPDTWNGFFLDATNEVGGLTHLDFTPLKNRRFQMNAVLALEDGTLYNTCNIAGLTFAGDNVYVGAGLSLTGRVEVHGGVSFIEGGAALSDLSSQFVPLGHGRGARVDSILLHTFPNVGEIPIVGGLWNGTFGGRSLAAQINQSPDSPNRFDGAATLLPGGNQPPLVFRLLGTVNGPGRFVMISQGNDGRLTGEGIIGTSPQRGTFGDARFDLRLFDGTRLFNTCNFSIGSILE